MCVCSAFWGHDSLFVEAFILRTFHINKYVGITINDFAHYKPHRRAYKKLYENYFGGLLAFVYTYSY